MQQFLDCIFFCSLDVSNATLCMRLIFGICILISSLVHAQHPSYHPLAQEASPIVRSGELLNCILDDDGFLWVVKTSRHLMRYDGIKKQTVAHLPDKFGEIEFRKIKDTLYVLEVKGKPQSIGYILNGHFDFTKYRRVFPYTYGRKYALQSLTSNWTHIISAYFSPEQQERTSLIFDSDSTAYVLLYNQSDSISLYHYKRKLTLIHSNIAAWTVQGYTNKLLLLSDGYIKILRQGAVMEQLVLPQEYLSNLADTLLFTSFPDDESISLSINGAIYTLEHHNLEHSFKALCTPLKHNLFFNLCTNASRSILFTHHRVEGLKPIFLTPIQHTYNRNLKLPQFYYSTVYYRGSVYSANQGRFNVGSKELTIGDGSLTFRSWFASGDTLLLTCKSDGIYRYNEGRFIRTLPMQLQGFHHNFCADRAGSIWCTDYQWVFEVNGKRKFKVDIDPKQEIELLKPWGENQLLVGTTNGVFSLNIQTGQSTRLHQTENLSVRDVFKLANDTLLLATQGKGLVVWTPVNTTLLNPALPQSLLWSHRILPMHNGSLWITSNNGLHLIHQKDILAFVRGKKQWIGFRFYGSEHGLKNEEFNGGQTSCGVSLADSLVILPTMQGLVFFNPNRLLELSDNEIPLVQIFNGKKQVISESREFNVSDPTHFKVISPQYRRSTATQLKYRLNPQLAWQTLGIGDSIPLHSLNPGNYRLEVLRIVFGGEESLADIAFHIRPVWYRSQAAHIGYIVLILLIGYLVYRIRSATLRKRANQLSAEVYRQKKQLIEQNTALQEAIKGLQSSETELVQQVVFREKLLAIMSHDVMGSLNAINKVGEEDLHSVAKASELKSIQQILDTSRTVYATVKGMLEWAKSQHSDLTPIVQDVTPHSLVNNIFEGLKLHPRRNEFELVNQIDPNTVINTDPFMLRSIIANLIENEIKHSPGGPLVINCTTQPRQNAISIVSTTTKQSASRVKELLSQPHSRGIESYSMDKGIGIILVRELIAKLNGNILLNPLEAGGYSIDIVLYT